MIDKTILHSLFCQYYSEMKHLARTLLYTEEEAEDTVQDVFVRFVEASQKGASPKNAEAYLMTAVRNSCINRIRQKSLTEQVKNLYRAGMYSETLRLVQDIHTPMAEGYRSTLCGGQNTRKLLTAQADALGSRKSAATVYDGMLDALFQEEMAPFIGGTADYAACERSFRKRAGARFPELQS